MKVRLQDADLLTETVRGWDLDFRQLDRGRTDATLAHISCGPVLITECAMNRQIEQHGAPPAGYRTIALPAHDDMTVIWRGHPHSGSSLMLFRSGGDLDSVSDPRFHVFTISIAEEWLRATELRLGIDVRRRFETGSDVLAGPRTRRQQLRNLITHLIETATARPNALADPFFREAVEEGVVTGVLETLDEAQPVRKRPVARNRGKVLRKAVQLIQERARDPVAISEVAHLSGASVRTLRYAFLEAFGITPKQYLQAYRLHHVHRRLKQAGPDETTVADVSNAWGFWHMGQFASDYRRMFDELPSETVAGCRIDIR